MRFFAVWLVGVLLTLPALGQEEGAVCVPLFADGNLGPFGWRSTLVVQNQETHQSQMRVHFYNANGDPLQLMLRGRGGQGQGHQVGPNGTLDPQPLGPGAGRSYRSGGGFGLQSGYCLVESEDRVQAHVRLHLMDGTGTLLDETSIIPGPQFGGGSFFADQREDQGVAFALTNPSNDQANLCTVELFEEEGTEPLGSVEVEIGPHSQVAQYLFDLFPGLLTGDVGFVRVSCETPVCGVALQLRGLRMLQIPISVEVVPAP